MLDIYSAKTEKGKDIYCKYSEIVANLSNQVNIQTIYQILVNKGIVTIEEVEKFKNMVMKNTDYGKHLKKLTSDEFVNKVNDRIKEEDRVEGMYNNLEKVINGKEISEDDRQELLKFLETSFKKNKEGDNK